MHTAVAEVSQEAGGGGASVSLRIYTDDLLAAVPTVAGPAADSALARYLRGTFALADRSGRPVRLAWVGAARTGDVTVIQLRAETGRLAGARVTSLVLCDRFEDQVNIVRAEYDGRTTTLLFSRGDASKALP